MKIHVILTLVAVCGTLCASKFGRSNRQKRLIFYDEQGHLMKNGENSIYQIGPKLQDNLFLWSFLNTFLSPIFPTISGKTSLAYMVPVSEAVVNQINKDPIYQNKIFYLTYIDPIIKANPLCDGKQTQIPSPNLCNNYLNCWDGWGYEQECPAGLLFSSQGLCDYPSNVDCKGRKLKNPNPLCSNNFEATVNPANCNEFFVCVNSIPVRFQCPDGLSYSEYLGVCDFPFRVNCNNTMGKPSAPSNPQIVQLSTTTSSMNIPIIPEKSMPGSVVTNTDKNSAINKMEYNTQTWSSTHLAISRQDAIRQLKLGSNESGPKLGKNE